MIHSPYLAKPGKKVDLSKLETADTGKFKDKDEAQPAIEKNHPLRHRIELVIPDRLPFGNIAAPSLSCAGA